MFDSSLSLSLSLVYSPVCVQHKIMTTTMRSGFVLDWLGNEFFVITIYSNLGRPWLEQSMCFIPFSITSCLAWRRAIALNQCCSRWRLDVLNFSLRSAMLLSSFTSCISLHSLSVRLNLVRLWISFCSAISFSTCDFARSFPTTSVFYHCSETSTTLSVDFASLSMLKPSLSTDALLRLAPHRTLTAFLSHSVSTVSNTFR